MLDQYNHYLKTVVIILFLSGVLLLGYRISETIKPETPHASDFAEVGFADPSAVYCKDLGYKYEISHTPEGDMGFCLFPNGNMCDAWDFLTGTCGADYSACARQGLKQEVHHDGENPFSVDYAVCVDRQGNKVNSVVDLKSLVEKATDGCETTLEVKDDGSETYEGEDILGETPSSFDWRNRDGRNFLTNVRAQGNCGSCWSFAAIGVMEAQMNISNNTVGDSFDLSEEYFVSDCLKNNDCCGGRHSTALTSMKDSGAPDEACMGYVDGDTATGCSCGDDSCGSNCRYNSSSACSDRTCSDRCENWSPRLVKLNEYAKVTSKRDVIKSALINKGPLSASIRMQGSFSNGIYKCLVDTPADHAVVIVGYDDANSSWIVRNSWGGSWGPNSNGYFNVGYGECSIEKNVYYAQLKGFKFPFTALASSTNGLVARSGKWKLNPTKSYYQSDGVANAWASVAYRGIFSNGTYTVKMRRTGTCSGCSNALLIRGDSTTVDASGLWTDYYAFQYANTGYYSIWKQVAGVNSVLVNWTSHSAIIKNNWNTLKVVSDNATPATVQFYINKTLVATITDSGVQKGQVGIRFYRDESPGKLMIDNAKMTLPDLTAIVASTVDEDTLIEGVEAEGTEAGGGTEELAP